ncbi:hypothetical protein NHX12_002073 [Muraenolepis orangiensis]|uniref:Ig-like domain-containing protein n=1 Tax=Muraenolepis orangiensis TaxID=630683 RepID=A0A9Q0DZS2_9TELE|nr:hypothetical protein NHX12_002073 [Muraenolepis orangiensis]
MLKRLLESKDAIISTLALINAHIDDLDQEEWEALQETCTVLEPFEQVTVEISSERHERERKYTRLSYIPSLSGRFEYLGDKPNLCTLRISDLRDEDKGEYAFKFSTNRDRWQSQDMALTVEGPVMTAVVPTVVKEGDMVRLTCSTACPGYLIENPVWSRDGEAVASPTFQARLEDAGSYQCAVEPLRSNAVALDVQCKTFVFGLSGGGVTVFATLGIVLAHDSQEGEIAYSTIGNFRETRPVKHRDSNVNLKEQPFESPEAGEAGGQHVIYSTV